MKVFLRVDSSLKMGTGHVMRCLTLAHVLKENGASVNFICRKHDGSLIDKIHSSGFNVYELRASEESEITNKLEHSHWLGSTQEEDANDCINIIKSKNIDWLIVDHYALDEKWEERLKPYCKKIIVIDDLADRNHQCEILLDQTFGRDKDDYFPFTPKNCDFLLGARYALLRPEFSRWREYSLRRRGRSQFKQLLITMGGVDVDNVTEKILDELKISTLPININIVVLMGESAPHLKAVKSKASSLPYKTEVRVGVNNVAEIMANTDIAIGASGATTWERCCLGLPSIQIVTARNQFFLSEALARHNIVKLVKSVKEITFLLEESSKWIDNIGYSASEICDGLGGYRVFNKMTGFKATLQDFGEIELCNYVNLNENDKTLALKMRNHPEIKKWMLNQDSISSLTHFEFIKSLESIIDRRYFLVKQKNKVIGSINFSEIHFCNSIELGLYVNPFLKLSGCGILLEAIASYYAFNELNVNKIKLEVYLDNKRAIHFYKKCGYDFIESKSPNYQDILCMEKTKILEKCNE